MCRPPIRLPWSPVASLAIDESHSIIDGIAGLQLMDCSRGSREFLQAALNHLSRDAGAVQNSKFDSHFITAIHVSICE